MSRIKQKKQGVINSLVWTQQDNSTAYISYDGTNFEISKPLAFGDGSAAVPSITFSNTEVMGIYRSGSNVIGFSTAGSERVTIDAQGDINVGTYISIGNGGTGSIIGDKKAVVEGVGVAGVVLTAADSGKVFFVNADTVATAYTLPAPAAGLHFKWIVTANCDNATTITTADTADTSGDMFKGGLLVSAAAAVNTFVEAGSDVNRITLDDNVVNGACGTGSWLEVICTEDPTWFVTGVINSTTDADGVGSAIFSDVDA
jgi:hypothetical protein